MTDPSEPAAAHRPAGDSLPRLHLPMRAPEDVIPHLGAAHHFREGRSAYLIAQVWFRAQRQLRGLPTMIRYVLDQRPQTAGAELIDAFLERKISLRDGRRPSQADALAILGTGGGLAVLAVEGKVDEPFGEPVADWIAAPSPDKRRRLANLAATLNLAPAATAGLRYQLLHRTASAIYEARRYRAATAVMMVHSFDPGDAGLADYKAFAGAIGLPDADATRLSGPVVCEGVELFLGWCADRVSDEGFTIVDGRKTDVAFHGAE